MFSIGFTRTTLRRVEGPVRTSSWRRCGLGALMAGPGPVLVAVRAPPIVPRLGPVPTLGADLPASGPSLRDSVTASGVSSALPRLAPRRANVAFVCALEPGLGRKGGVVADYPVWSQAR